MSQSDDAVWQELCKEHKAASDAYFQTFSIINSKFALGQNPTADELSKSDAAWDAFNDVKRRMDEFLNAFKRSLGQT